METGTTYEQKKDGKSLARRFYKCKKCHSKVYTKEYNFQEYVREVIEKIYIKNFLELIELAIGSIFGIGIVESIQVPFIYKYGAEKGRIQIFIAIAAVAFLLGGILWLGEKYGVNFLDMNINAFMKLLPIVLVMATAIVYFVSFKISYKIYEKKEM